MTRSLVVGFVLLSVSFTHMVAVGVWCLLSLCFIITYAVVLKIDYLSYFGEAATCGFLWKDDREQESLASATSTSTYRAWLIQTHFITSMLKRRIDTRKKGMHSLPSPISWPSSHIESVIAAMAGVFVYLSLI
uniref:Uncharacterized protein n=1 Tax=Tanacetum cinerariifolium TaxID=118510 RepID=A0A6L2K0Z4_TANCI|nr:hypothetical protein [Tanacetum cinerariifolium]